jgi:hypothetical protein
MQIALTPVPNRFPCERPGPRSRWPTSMAMTYGTALRVTTVLDTAGVP